jgi:ankyrin repeat protein
MDLHQLVRTAFFLEDLQDALENGADVNAPNRLGNMPLMAAIDVRDVEKMELLIEYGADPELTCDSNYTALRYAVCGDFAEGVQFLLSLDVDRGHAPKYPLKPVSYDITLPEIVPPKELRGLIPEGEWKQLVEETRAMAAELLQHPTVKPMIADVESVEVLQLFLEAGDDLNQASNELKRSYIGLTEAVRLSLRLTTTKNTSHPGLELAIPRE